MNPDDEVCLCFRVSLRKVRTFCKQQDPPVASLISECLGAGTGCQWCVPFLRHLHQCHVEGKAVDLKVSPEEYMKARLGFHKTKSRDPKVVDEAMGNGPENGPKNGPDGGTSTPT